MFYFISSWYSKDEQWFAKDNSWYRKETPYAFDDTINQLRMFREAKESAELLILSYAPGLRLFLHRQGLYPTPYWSAFDMMQGIRGQELGLFSYLDLSWPRDMVWRYTPFTVVGFCKGKKYARVEFGEEGRVIWIEYYNLNGEICHRDIYDDRGFLSSTVVFQCGRMVRQEFYDENGILQFTENKETGEVRVTSDGRHQFRKKTYDSLQSALEEMLRNRFVQMDPDATVVIAANAVHNQMIMESRKGQPVVLSFFEDRYDIANEEKLRCDLAQASFAVTDTENVAQKIREAADAGFPVYDISPFDTRLSLGKSQMIRELKVYMPITGLEPQLLQMALEQVIAYMVKNQRVELYLVIAEESEKETQELVALVNDILVQNGIKAFGICMEGGPVTRNECMGEEEEIPGRIIITAVRSENEVIRKLYDVRLILDVRDQPDLYLQIAGISAGIPQINYRFTRYVQHQRDGYIIQNIHYITGALEYYLDGLKHWNEALVYCVKEIERHNGETLVAQWKAGMARSVGETLAMEGNVVATLQGTGAVYE